MDFDCMYNRVIAEWEVQVLIHPIWWTEDNKNRNEILNELGQGELDSYKQYVEKLRLKYQNYISELEKSN